MYLPIYLLTKNINAHVNVIKNTLTWFL